MDLLAQERTTVISAGNGTRRRFLGSGATGKREVGIGVVLNHGLDTLGGSGHVRCIAYTVEHDPTPRLLCGLVVVKPKGVEGCGNLIGVVIFITTLQRIMYSSAHSQISHREVLMFA